MNSVVISPIAYIRTDFKEKFGIPRQSGRCKNVGQIIFMPEFRNPDALREIEGFTHLWLIFDFSKCHREKYSPTVRPPRLGGNKKIGVFASRSPFRPNPIGLSSVKLLEVRKTEEFGLTLIVEGADLLDETPIFDIKPYLPFTDCHTDAVGGYSNYGLEHKLNVVLPEILKEQLPKEKLNALISALEDDPRPSYIEDEKRVYKMSFADKNVSFNVKNNVLTIIDIE